MISNCDFLSSDIVISKSASGVRGPGPGLVSTLWTDSGSGSKWASHLPSPASLARARSLSRLSSLPTLYIRLEMEMSRDPATGHRHHNPEKARAERRPEPSRDDQADQASSDRMKSWDDFVTVARAAGSATSHNNKNILYASSSSELGLSLGRVGLAFNPWDCNNNPAQYWPVWPGVICVQVFTWWGPGQAVLVSECSELPEPLIIAPCPVIVRLCSARLLS